MLKRNQINQPDVAQVFIIEIPKKGFLVNGEHQFYHIYNLFMNDMYHIYTLSI